MRYLFLFILCFFSLGCEQSIPENSASDVEKFIEKLKVKNLTQKFTTVEKIGLLGENGAPAIPELQKLLQDTTSRDRLRKAIISTFVKIGEKALPALREAFANHSRAFRIFILKEMHKLQEKDLKAMLTTIETSLQDKSSQVRDEATELLVLYKEKAIPNLIARVADPAWQVRKTVAESLSNINSLRTLPTLKILFADKDWRVQLQASKGLASTGFYDKNTLSFLLTSSIEDRRIRGSVSEIIVEKIKKDSKSSVELSTKAITVLLKAVYDKKNYRSTFSKNLLVRVRSTILQQALIQNLQQNKHIEACVEVITNLEKKQQELYCDELKKLKNIKTKTQEKINNITK
ncbi:HEAT repeat domain-containing protein [Candidatus Uabimicrobium sp. HlEnr_7]|uniref:HEAT repeat domain-containing protein n=1 Tax=Candidatus Uabimicrobium helgolandensis TaxID=3095367 RepID=UPI003555E59D